MVCGDATEFPASVPGNIQKDYADFHNWHDINYSDNCKLFLPIEDFAWCYKTRLEFEKQEGERYEVSLPAVDADRLFVVLKTKKYGESRYMLKYDKQ